MLTAGLLEKDSAALAVADHCRPATALASTMWGTVTRCSRRALAPGTTGPWRRLSTGSAAVYGGAYRVLGDAAAAQDVVQDVFVELWSHPGRYDPAACPLRAYLVLLARHRAVDIVRSELRRVARQEHSYRLVPRQPDPTPLDEAMESEAAAAVRAAVRRLPDGQRRIVELAYFDGLTCREAAKAAGIPEGTAKSRLRLALVKLETMLDREFLESS